MTQCKHDPTVWVPGAPGSDRMGATVSVVDVTVSGAGSWSIPPLFTRLVDDISLLRPRSSAPDVPVVVARYLTTRDGPVGDLVGQLACPISRLPELVAELARVAPAQPVDLSLMVDTGLGGVPKALSTVLSRASLVTPRTVEMAAPPDVDGIWLERVSEFVPEDVAAVVEPRRPTGSDPAATEAWLAAVRRVTKHGCVPRLRCDSVAARSRAADVPSVTDVERFVRVAVEAGRGFTVLGLRRVVRVEADGRHQHGMLNLLVAVARAVVGADGTALRDALASTDGAGLAAEAKNLSDQSVAEVRGLLARCGADPEPAPDGQLAGLGLLA